MYVQDTHTRARARAHTHTHTPTQTHKQTNIPPIRSGLTLSRNLRAATNIQK